MKVVSVISFGPVESKSNGYFIRVWNILNALSKLNKLKLIVLEFPERKITEKVKVINNVIFVNLRGNEVSQNKISKMLKRILTFDPLHAIKFQILSLYELLRFRKLIAKSDVVIIEGALLISALLISKLLKKKVVLDMHCINKLLAKRYKSINKLVHTLRVIVWDLLERISIKLSDLIIVVSTEEMNFVMKEYGIDPRHIVVVPNVIELPKEVPREVVEELRQSLGLKNEIVLIFVGDLEAIHNADAVNYIINELAPWIWRKQKDIVFLIIGRGAEKFQRNSPNVVFTGFVRDLVPYLMLSDACIVPLRVGAGTKTKILECLAYGKLVITTPIGIEGLENIVKETKQVIVTDINSFKEVLLDVVKEIKRKKTREFECASTYLKIIHEEFNNSIKKIIKWISSST